MATHRILIPGIKLSANSAAIVDGDEAGHAIKAKRIAPGDAVVLMNGLGDAASATVVSIDRSNRRNPMLRLEFEQVVRHEPTSPVIDVFAAAPKGGRIDDMIDGLAQVGAASWSPLVSSRTVVNPRESKLNRIERLCVEAAKQCGRPFLMSIGRATKFKDVLRDGGHLVMADASGTPYEPAGDDTVRLLIGPEGGWADEELEAARAAGAVVASFGIHTMRTELAAVVATSLIIDQHRRAAHAPLPE